MTDQTAVEAYVKDLRAAAAALDEATRLINSDHRDLRAAAEKGAGTEGWYVPGVLIKMGDEERRTAHRINQAQRHLEDLTQGALRLLDIATGDPLWSVRSAIGRRER